MIDSNIYIYDYGTIADWIAAFASAGALFTSIWLATRGSFGKIKCYFREAISGYKGTRIVKSEAITIDVNINDLSENDTVDFYFMELWFDLHNPTNTPKMLSDIKIHLYGNKLDTFVYPENPENIRIKSISISPKGFETIECKIKVPFNHPGFDITKNLNYVYLSGINEKNKQQNFKLLNYTYYPSQMPSE